MNPGAKSTAVRRAVIGFFSVGCALFMLYVGSRVRDVWVASRKLHELSWHGLQVTVPAGFMLVPASTQGVLAVLPGNQDSWRQPGPSMGFQYLGPWSHSPYADLGRRCAKRAGCQTQVDSTRPRLTCLLRPQSNSQQLAACHVDGSKVEGFFAGPDSLWPLFLGTFRRAHGKT
jgi:hypothetical protein